MARPPTPSQTIGPFFGFALPFRRDGEASDNADLRIEGRVLDGAGEPVADALLELWEGERFARRRTDIEGAYHFTAPTPPAGYFNLTVFARGVLKPLQTRIYLPGANAGDPVLKLVEPDRRSTLIAHADGPVLSFDVRLQGEDETVFFASDRPAR